MMNVGFFNNPFLLFFLQTILLPSFQNNELLQTPSSSIVVSGFVVRSPASSSRTLHHRSIGRKNSDDDYYSYSSDEDDDFDDDDDDERIDVADKDWRDFRAKLVMGESSSSEKTTKTQSSTKKSSSSSFVEDDGDLDGIGALFASSSDFETTSNEDTASTSSSTTAESLAQQGLTPLDPSQWAYDSGKIIEKGAIILGGVEQDYGFGLRQQYFHKAAILVLDHDENVFTKGIILNRPTSLTLEDDVNIEEDGIKWKVWFGGDVQGLDSPLPDIVCLHSLKDPQVTRASIQVMKDIQWTTFDNAKRLVSIGVAKPDDFWLFAGYAGWGPQQLMGELDRKSWYMVATDSQTLLKELKKLGDSTQSDSGAGTAAAAGDPRDAGLDTWTLLMNMIGRGEIAKECNGNFDDLMLKEWALQHLCDDSAQEQKEKPKESSSSGVSDVIKSAVTDPFETLIKRVQQQSSLSSSSSRDYEPPKKVDIKEGTLLRGSSVDRSPFLLENQEYHKSVILVLSQDESITIGVMLNRVAPKGLDIQFKDTKTGKTSVVTMPLRFGGQYAVKGTDPLLWLHCNPVLKTAKIGSPVANNPASSSKKNSASTSTSTRMFSSSNDNEFWKCTADDVINAITRKLATTDDFIVVSGVSVWTKKGVMGRGSQQAIAAALAAGLDIDLEEAGGLQEDVRQGRFEVIPKSQTYSIWDAMAKQNVLTQEDFEEHIQQSNEVWEASRQESDRIEKRNDLIRKEERNGDATLADDDDKDSNLVYKTNVKVSKLSDDALKSWVATFLLQKPTRPS